MIHILKENRTHDQLFGDLGVGDGDPSLTMYGAEITPNQHKLTRAHGLGRSRLKSDAKRSRAHLHDGEDFRRMNQAAPCQVYGGRWTKCLANGHSLWSPIEPCPSLSLALQIENRGLPSRICNSNFGFSLLSHKAARCLVRYRRGPPSALSLRSRGRGIQTNSVSRTSLVTCTTA